MRLTMVVVLAAGAVAALLVGVLMVFLFAVPDRTDKRFATPERSVVSPSGRYTAEVIFGPEQNGVRTWIARIRDGRSGELVFVDDYAYSTRHRLRITWLSTADQLWLISGDVGTSHVDAEPDGSWTKTPIGPGGRANVPEEIRRLL
jgi:hypothetical protein